jgi:hypothetical protein
MNLDRENQLGLPTAPVDPSRTSRRKRATPYGFVAFRAAVEVRLLAIERELAEAKQRINALLLMAAGTVVSAVAVRLAELLG